MALTKVKSNLERLFDKNLNDLVRGIRNHKEDEAKYIAACLEEIKAELRQHNLSVKTNAVAKLTYLQVPHQQRQIIFFVLCPHFVDPSAHFFYPMIVHPKAVACPNY